MPAGKFTVKGIPGGAEAAEGALLRGRLITAATDFTRETGATGLTLVVSNEARPAGGGDSDEQSIADRASHYRATQPLFSFESLVLPHETRDQLLLGLAVIELRKAVFEDWNLRSIEPHPSSALNFHGEPGTGKTLAAHAVADRLGKRIIHTKYSQLESKYHGEGPKNLDALFYAAREQDAVLFLDEADSLMSQRFEQMSQGSEHAVNAMRSSLLLALDEYEGLVIFATNLVEAYDKAFDSRVRQVKFPVPDEAARELIWRRLLVPGLPLAPDVSPGALAALAPLVGREIRTAVIDAATQARLDGRPHVDQDTLVRAVGRVMAQRITRPARPVSVPAGSAEAARLRGAALRALAGVPGDPAPAPENQPIEES
jgi:ATPase family associated with various cellular activities (AAA)